MTNRQLRWSLGIFTVIALTLLAILILLFGSLPTLFKRTNSYTVRFTDAPGLRPGSPVRRSGVRIGEVTDITLREKDGEVYVYAGIKVEQSYTVRHSELPTLVVTILGTDASVDFFPKPAPPPGQQLDSTPYPPGSEIEGYTPVTVSALLSRASEVVPTTQETLNDMRKSIKRLEETVPLMEQTMREYRDLGRSLNRDFPDLAKSVRGTSEDVGATAREYRRLGENLNVLLLGNQDKIIKALDNLNLVLERVTQALSDANIKNVTEIIKNLRDASTQAPAIVKNTREASDHLPSMATNLDELLKEARQMVPQVQRTLTRAESALADLQKTSQLFGERGPTIAKNLDESLDKLNRVMTDVRELMRVIGQSDGTLNRILKDPSLYNNLDQATCAIAKMLPRLDRILKDLETFADKLARHPELIGAGGAIKGSDGLKDPPKIGVPPR
jgi:phospholipid/cholesterol/gamma-HCH transport system substrate-binding protein